MYGLADELIAERRRAPGDDVISALVAAHDGDGRLTHEELRAMITLIVFGGMDTTKNQLGLAMQLFIDHPDQWELLAGTAGARGKRRRGGDPLEPDRRLDDAAGRRGHHRRGPRHPRAGRRCTCSARRPTPTRLRSATQPFDITVERRAHFGFGGGAHHCLGHWLARIDMREALPLLARRLRAAAARAAGDVPPR